MGYLIFFYIEATKIFDFTEVLHKVTKVPYKNT
jgi:hypothetical protein